MEMTLMPWRWAGTTRWNCASPFRLVVAATGHDGGGRAVDVRVEQADFLALLRERDGEVDADRRLADATPCPRPPR